MRTKQLTMPQQLLLADLLKNGADTYSMWGNKMFVKLRTRATLQTIDAMRRAGCLITWRNGAVSNIAITEKGKTCLQCGFVYQQTIRKVKPK